MKKGLYIHIPFCKTKCPYCDFYSVTDLSLIDKYVDAVVRNIKSIDESDMNINSVYFGGGTPSVLTSEQIMRILSAINPVANAEISMEANPDDVCENYLREIKKAGVNRLSFGVQTLDDNELKLLGRRHNAQTAINAIRTAKTAGFENVSADIMLGIPMQTMDSLSDTIKKLLELPLTHISAYMLKIEPETPLARDMELVNSVARDDVVADMYLYAVNEFVKAGFMQYEISNFAKSGFECKHNLKYWNCCINNCDCVCGICGEKYGEATDEYYGIGPSAHSCVNGVRTACDMSLEEFISADKQRLIITEENGGNFKETAMLNLRLTQTGFDTDKYPERKAEILNKATPFAFSGLLKIDEGVITLTPEGCLVSNEIIVKLFM